MNAKMGLKEWAMVLATGVFFGSSFVFINIAVESLPPITVAAGRALVAGAVIWAVLRVAGERLPRPGREWGPLLIIGLLTGAIPFATIALARTASTNRPKLVRPHIDNRRISGTSVGT